jgi:hypothetical protein
MAVSYLGLMFIVLIVLVAMAGIGGPRKTAEAAARRKAAEQRDLEYAAEQAVLRARALETLRAASREEIEQALMKMAEREAQ